MILHENGDQIVGIIDWECGGFIPDTRDYLRIGCTPEQLEVEKFTWLDDIPGRVRPGSVL
jgi:hypothetical protein